MRRNQYDVAVQKYELQHAFPEYSIEAFIMLADKNQEADFDGLNQKFQLVKYKDERSTVVINGDTSLKALGNKILTEINVDNIVERIFNGTDTKQASSDSFEDLIKTFAKAYSDDVMLFTPIGSQCAKCEYKSSEPEELSGFNECWKKQTSLTDSDLSKPLIYGILEGSKNVSKRGYII
jgi:hypothetical protein